MSAPTDVAAGLPAALPPPDAQEWEVGASDSLWRLTLRRFLAHRLAVISLLVLALIVLAVLAGPLLSPYDPNKPELDDIFLGPSPAHPFGTDSVGRDLLTRVLYGGRISLLVGTLAVTVAIGLGVLVGAVSGFLGGVVDVVLMRFVDVMLSFPRLFLLILASVFLRDTLPSVLIIILVLGTLSWMGVARLVRGSFLSLREREFIEAAKAAGTRNRHLVLRHLLPNAMAPIIVAATLGVATAIISESTLSFLGLGIQPPTPSWGNMLKDAETDMMDAPWVAVFPGLAIFLVVVAINFVGDGLRDALDPRHVQRRRE
ncbi:MAG TPA: oligopeptide ABC transporter permease [Candidatus Dormibacteraeota bacterium]